MVFGGDLGFLYAVEEADMATKRLDQPPASAILNIENATGTTRAQKRALVASHRRPLKDRTPRRFCSRAHDAATHSPAAIVRQSSTNRWYTNARTVLRLPVIGPSLASAATSIAIAAISGG